MRAQNKSFGSSNFGADYNLFYYKGEELARGYFFRFMFGVLQKDAHLEKISHVFEFQTFFS